MGKKLCEGCKGLGCLDCGGEGQVEQVEDTILISTVDDPKTLSFIPSFKLPTYTCFKHGEIDTYLTINDGTETSMLCMKCYREFISKMCYPAVEKKDVPSN